VLFSKHVKLNPNASVYSELNVGNLMRESIMLHTKYINLFVSLIFYVCEEIQLYALGRSVFAHLCLISNSLKSKLLLIFLFF